MSETTDFATLLHFKSMQNQIEELTTLLKNAERERDEARAERDQLKEALLIMENLLKPGVELFPEIGQFFKGGKK